MPLGRGGIHLPGYLQKVTPTGNVRRKNALLKVGEFMFPDGDERVRWKINEPLLMKASCLSLAISLLLPAVLHATTTTTLEEFAASAPHGPSLAEVVERARHAARPVEDAPGQWWVQNPANGLNARFTPEGLSMSVVVTDADGGADTGRLFTRWSTVGIGYGETLAPVREGEVSADLASPGRVEIVRPGLVEWFVNGKEGLEHGWTLSERPAGGEEDAPLRVEIALEGDLDAEVTADGRYVVLRNEVGVETLRYQKLKVWDAGGRELAARMVGGGKTLTIEVDDAGAIYPLTIDPMFTQQAYLKASNTGADDEFGWSVSVSGDTAVVGAYREDSTATGVNGNQSSNGATDSGAAYVFTRSGSTWTQQAYLKPSNTGADDRFGWSVSVSGDTAVIGAPWESSAANGVNGNQSDNSDSTSGAAYVFTRSGSTWTQQAYLKASNTGASDQFGTSVSVFGDTVVVGAYGEDSTATGVNGNQSDNGATESGAAYVFTRSGSTWTQQAYLKASNTGADDRFGWSVSVSGDTAVVGAYREDSTATGVNGNQSSNGASNSGAVYVFTRNGSTWTQQAYLKASNTGADDQFGISVSVSGDTAVIGAYGEGSSATGVNGNQSDNGAVYSGAAYVFTRSGSTWTQQAYLKASNTDEFDAFGTSVAVDGDTAVVGAPWESSAAAGVNGNQSDNGASSSGAVYVFTRSGSTWTQQAYLKASNTGAGDEFGTSVAVDADTAVAGALWEDSSATGVDGNQSDNGASGSGAVYAFHIENETTPTLSLDPRSQSMATGGGSQSFAVTASGNWSWSVDGGTGWFSSAEASNQSGDQTFSYTVAANGNPFPRVATVTVTSGSLSQTYTITQAGTVAAPAISLSGNLGFGSVSTGQTATRTLTIQNTGGVPLTVTGISYPAGFSGDWSGGTIAAEGSQAVAVTFAPTAAQEYGGNLAVSSNASAGDPTHAVSGTGTAAPPSPALTLLQKPRPFAATRVGKRSGAQTLRITNGGGSPLVGLRVVAGGRAKRDFILKQPALKILSPGAATTFKATFRPREKGPRKAVLEVRSNAAMEKAPLSGRGKAMQPR